MLTVQSVFAREFKKLLQEHVERISNDIVYGAAIDSYEKYRERVGEVRGLLNAIELIDDAEERTNSIERGL